MHRHSDKLDLRLHTDRFYAIETDARFGGARSVPIVLFFIAHGLFLFPTRSGRTFNKKRAVVNVDVQCPDIKLHLNFNLFCCVKDR